MFCPKCGSKLSDGARFCTECGLPLGGLSAHDNETPGNELAVAPTDNEPAIESAEASTAEPAEAAHSPMINFFMQKRQIGSRLVPQFAIMIAAFIAAAGIAYAAVMVYKNVIEPNLRQPTQQEQPAEEPEKAEKKEDKTKQVNEAAHTAYQDVLEQYREALTNGDYDDYADAETSQSDAESKYFTDQESNSKYPLVSRDAASSIGMYENGISADGSMYVFIDLNDDGVDELVLGAATDWSEDNYILAVYAYIGGQVKGVCKSWYRNGYFLRQGKVFIHDCPSGMFAHVTTVEKYKADAEFETLDKVDMFGDDGDKTITTIRTKNGQEVSRVTESADSNNRESGTIFSELYADYPVDPSIAWQPLN